MGKRPSAGEINQRALGSQSVQEYLDVYAPIERTVANDLLSTAGQAAEKGRVQAENGMAWSQATQTAQGRDLAMTGPQSGRFIASTLENSRQRGTAAGMARVATTQEQVARRSSNLLTGMKQGRTLQGVSTGAMRGSDLAAHGNMMDQDRLKAERSARIYGMAGEVAGAGLGAYGQHKAAPKTSGGSYYTQNGKTYWNDGTLADNGMAFT